MQKNVIEYMNVSAKNYPDKICYSDENTSYTFSEVYNISKKIAGSLLSIANKRKPIIIYMEKNCNALLCMWAAIISGNFYVIIDPSLPFERINKMLEVLSTDTIITDRKYETSIEKTIFVGKRVIFEDIINNNITKEVLDIIENSIEQICDIDPVYAMFTSGSTGIPKCVLVSHRSVIDFIDNFVEIFEIKNTDIFANQAPFDFDVSVKDIFSCIKVGATLNIIPKKYFIFPKQLVDFLEERNVNTLVWAVSALCILSSRNIFEYKVPSKIEKVIFSGEVMPVKQLLIWMKYYPNTVFANVYGPTEITCNCTYYIIDKSKLDTRKPIPIGKEFPNKRVILISDDGNIIHKSELNTIGEICVMGSGLALGYYGDREKTKKVFVKNPFDNNKLEIIYKTGDLAYYMEDGNLYYAGRKDLQIKYMGHRIELLEIDQIISSIDGINGVCTFFDQDKDKIISFFEGEIDNKDILKLLVKTLPKFMIPTEFIKLDRLPINKNGKIDRKNIFDEYLRGNMNG